MTARLTALSEETWRRSPASVTAWAEAHVDLLERFIAASLDNASADTAVFVARGELAGWREVATGARPFVDENCYYVHVDRERHAEHFGTMAVIADRFRVVGEVFGDEEYGLLRAVDPDGRRCLLSIVPLARGTVLPSLLGEARWSAPGIAKVIWSRGDVDGRDLLVEEEPPGLPSSEAPPLAPGQVRDAALALARLLLASPPGLTGVRPELVYLDGGALSGIAPRYVELFTRGMAGLTRTGWRAPYSLVYLSPEEVRAVKPLTRAHDLYALGTMLAFWSSGGVPPYRITSDESMVAILMRIIEGQSRLADDGPFAEVIAACLRGEALDDIVRRLEALRLDAADEAYATRARLVAEVVARPDDDGPRLVLADWLLERGDPRGELIEVQCELAREPTPALEARAAELIAAHGLRWGAHLLPDASDWTFERGFVARVRRADRAALRRRRAALLAHGPLPSVG